MDQLDKHSPPGLPAPAHSAITYAQDRDGRYLCADGRVLAIIVGVTGLEAQRLGTELAAAPAALDAIARALPWLEAAQARLALCDAPAITRKQLYAAQATLTGALLAARRAIPEPYTWHHPEPATVSAAAD